MHRALFCLVLVLGMAAGSKDDWSSLWWLPPEGDAPAPGKQVAVTNGGLPHLMYVPQGEAPVEGWPLLVFLHGQGESSPTPLPMVALQGPPQTAGRDPGALGTFAVLSPQKPRRAEFFDDDVAVGILGLVETYAKAFGLDASRVYLTGVSQGGIGTWNLAAKYPERFAAIAPVAGGLRSREGATRLKDMPIWAFHAANDVVLPVDMSDRSVKACDAVADRSAGPVKYTRVPEAPGHDPSWAAAGIPEMPGHGGMCEVAYYPRDGVAGIRIPLYAWLLQFRRRGAEARG